MPARWTRRLAAAVGRHEYVSAALLFSGIALAWMWPLLIDHQLGQSYQLFDAVPWRGSGSGFDLPKRFPYLDAGFAFEPWASIAGEQLQGGHLPLWNPNEYAGTTLAGNMQSALFFPLTWVSLLLPFGYAWGLIALAKLVIAGTGAFALARELKVPRGGALLAGCIYMLSGPLMFWLQWPLAAGFALFPWVLLATARCVRRPGKGPVAGVAAATGLTILAGHPETTVISVSLAAVFGLALIGFERLPLRATGAWLAGAVLGAGLAAVSIVPFVQALDASATLDRDVPSAGPSVASLLGFGMPRLLGNGEPSLYGWPFGYFGLPALVLASLALWRLRANPAARALSLMALVVLLAVFRVPPLSFLLEHLPPWSIIYLADTRAYFALALAGALGAGAGFGLLVRRPLSYRGVVAVAGGAGLVILVGFALANFAGDLAAPAAVKRQSVIITAALLVATAVLLLIPGRLKRGVALAGALAVCIASLGDLQDFNVILPRAEAYPAKPRAIDRVQRQPGAFRTIALRTKPYLELPNNTAASYGLQSIEGYDFPLSQRWSDFQRQVLGFTGPPPLELKAAHGPPRPPGLKALRMMNVRAYVAAPGTPPPRGFQTLYSGPDAVVFWDRGALPRAYVVPRTREASESQALRLLARGDLDARREALVPPGARATAPRAAFAPARVQQVSPDHLRVQLPPGGGGWLVLANAFSPAWHAKAGGRELSLEPTNSVAMGVAVPRGARAVDFRLDRSAFYTGALISGLSLLVILALGILSGRRRGPS